MDFAADLALVAANPSSANKWDAAKTGRSSEGSSIAQSDAAVNAVAQTGNIAAGYIDPAAMADSPQDSVTISPEAADYSESNGTFAAAPASVPESPPSTGGTVDVMA